MSTGYVRGTAGTTGVSQSVAAEEARATAAENARRNRFIDQGAAKTAPYIMAAWHSVKFDCASGTISQPLPLSPADGDEVYVLNATALGGNDLTITGTGGPFTLAPQFGDVYYWTGLTWEPHEGRRALAALDNRYQVISVADSSGDVAAIQAAIATQTTGGKPSGRWETQQGKIARISTPTTITLGYTNTQNANWSTDTTTERVKLSLDILPDAGLGTALTIKGGYGVELDINVLGGGARGTVTDATISSRSTSADGQMTAGDLTNVLTSAAAAFTSADVGVPVAIPGAGSGGATLYGNISSVTDATHAVLNTAATTTVTTASVVIGSRTVSSPAAIAAGLAAGAVVFINGAGPSPEGVSQPLAASVRTVNSGAGTFTVSEGCWSSVVNATMNWFDVAVRVEDLTGARLHIYGKGFQGYLLGADATDDSTKRLRSCLFRDVIGNGCGGTLFWKSIEAFGSLGRIMSNTIYGDYVGQTADLHWAHWEGGISQPTNQLARAYLWFDRSATNNGLSVSAGDRSTEAAVLMTGDSASSNSNMGRFTQVRATMYQSVVKGATITSGSNQITNAVSQSLTVKVGQRLVGLGIPEGTTVTAVSGTWNGYTTGSPGTITMSANATATNTNQVVYGVTSDGLKMIGVASCLINNLDTTHCTNGLHVIGGGSTGIRILNHKALSADIAPVYVEPGTTGAPRLDINADYRFILGYCLDLASGLSSSAEVRLSGHVDSVHQGSTASGKCAARSASSTAKLDVSLLRQKSVSGLLGFIDTSTVTLLGRPTARLENEVPAASKVFTTNGAGGWTASDYLAPGALLVATAQNQLTNTTTEAVVGGPYTIPANSVVAGTTYKITIWGNVSTGTTASTATLRCRMGGVTGASLGSVSLNTAASKSNQAWTATFIVTSRATASSSTPLSLGGLAHSASTGGLTSQPGTATNVNMTVSRDLVAAAVWSVADASAILNVEGCIIEQVK
jgi:hypothetical protein